MEREIPLYTLDGVPDAETSTHWFHTEDGLGLSMLRFEREPSNDIVLIIHGLTTSSDMFIMPEHENLVRYLLDHGFGDVWTLDFRMSNRHPYNLLKRGYTMDDVALYDFPAALAKLREVAGNKRIHVICHCLGSVSFLMSLFSGTVDGVTSVIANSAGLTPHVPFWSRIKGSFGATLVENLLGFAYVDPSWGESPGMSRYKLFAKSVSFFHRECDVPACHMLSLLWGSGWPALYLHDNLLPVTHRRGGDLYGATTMHYHRHMFKMIKAGGRAVKYDPSNPKHDRLPNDYLEHAAEIKTPILFVTGNKNHVFKDSNILCYETLQKLVPGRHELHVFKNYGHQDVFMGKNVAVDIFPRFLQFLEKHRARRGAQEAPAVAAS
jgi:lysosomal acid lipase/cholesteryl ester hydrolase